MVINVSPRTAEPSEVKSVKPSSRLTWKAFGVTLRAGAPAVLTNKHAVALAGKLYRGWAEGEGRERTVGTARVPVGEAKSGEAPKQWRWVPDNDAMDGEPAVWAKAAAFLDKPIAREAEYRPDQDPEGTQQKGRKLARSWMSPRLGRLTGQCGESLPRRIKRRRLATLISSQSAH